MPHLPIARYKRAGRFRPSAGGLHDLIETRLQPEQSVLDYLLLKGHLYLDLAVSEPEQASRWVRASQAQLDHVIEFTDRYEGTDYPRTLPARTDAMLRRADLANWLCAASGFRPASNYQEKLQAACEVLPLLGLLKSGADKVTAQLQEYIPILLTERFGREGDVGRLALLREEADEDIPQGKNYNWDTGLMPASEASSFIDPSIRLAVRGHQKTPGSLKRSRLKAQSYRNAGVVPISAGQLGFGNPKQVILSCVQEYEPVPAAVRGGVKLLSSDRLDAMTQALWDECTSPPLATAFPKIEP